MEENIFQNQTVETPIALPKPWLKIILFSVLGLVLVGGLVVAGFQLRKKQERTLIQFIPTPYATIIPTQPITPTPTLKPASTIVPDQTANWRTYKNEKYGFSFKYPQSWQISDVQGPDGQGISLSIADKHTISIQVWRVTGFGYCYQYGEKKEILVGGKGAETADGVGGSEMCDRPEEYVNRGNTFVLIPIDNSVPRNQLHISCDYPLKDKNLAKSNLNQILSTFKFLD